MKKQQGFTLVELLVVVAIIGLLSTMAVVSLNGIRERARDTKRISDIDAIQKSMELVKSEFGGYDKAGCAAASEAVSKCIGGNLETYLPAIKNMNDPLWIKLCPSADTCKAGSCNYTFQLAATADSYTINFYLEKGVANYTSPGCYKLTEKGISQVN